MGHFALLDRCTRNNGCAGTRALRRGAPSPTPSGACTPVSIRTGGGSGPLSLVVIGCERFVASALRL
eukprot:10723190-Alexandrium_andersonii.AAC.1